MKNSFNKYKVKKEKKIVLILLFFKQFKDLKEANENPITGDIRILQVRPIVLCIFISYLERNSLLHLEK